MSGRNWSTTCMDEYSQAKAAKKEGKERDSKYGTLNSACDAVMGYS